MSARELLKLSTVLVMVALLAPLGCYHTSVDTSEYTQGPAPLRMPSPGRQSGACCSYEDSLTGGKVFTMYCGYCHNARSLAERPFASYQNAAAHMRVVANLTGKEYAELLEFMRRFHDIPPPHPAEEPSPKRFFFSQPIAELKKDGDKKGSPEKKEQEDAAVGQAQQEQP